MGGGMRGPGRRMQGGTRIENPGKVFKRLMAYMKVRKEEEEYL